jgi:ribosome-binding ATPase YchF (GTP1/OBG family)
VVKAKTGDKQALIEEKVCRNIMQTLKNGQFASTVTMNDEELKYVKNYNLLTMKPILYVANINENDIHNPEQNVHYQKLKQFISTRTNDQIIAISISLEYEISKLSDEDRPMFMVDLGISQTGLDRLIQTTYKLLNLFTFFTFGKSEVKA